MATATATKLRPLGDRVVVQPLAREEMTKSGIVLPDTAAEKPQEGSISTVGAIPDQRCLHPPHRELTRRTT